MFKIDYNLICNAFQSDTLLYVKYHKIGILHELRFLTAYLIRYAIFAQNP